MEKTTIYQFQENIPDPEAKISRQLIVIKEARKLLENDLYYQVDNDSQDEKCLYYQVDSSIQVERDI